MFKLILMAMHFSPYNQNPLDPTVFEILKRELNPKPQNADNVVDLQPARAAKDTRKAA